VSYSSIATSNLVRPGAPRYYCRNPRCGLKLNQPADNPRDAFCCQGCFNSHYRSRCLVCERLIDHKTTRRQVCGRSKCRHELQRHRERFEGTRYLASVLGHNASRSAHFTGLKNGDGDSRPFRQIAGPKLSSTSFWLATLPLDLETAARIAKANISFVDWSSEPTAAGAATGGAVS
jgi:hypothetical protein